MKLRAVAVAALTPMLVLGQPFEERFAQPKRERTAEGDEYMTSLMPVFQRVGRSCLSESAYAANGPKPQLKRFRLVGTIGLNQMVADIQVDVQSSYSACVASKLEKVPVPKPPIAPFALAVELSYPE